MYQRKLLKCQNCIFNICAICTGFQFKGFHLYVIFGLSRSMFFFFLSENTFRPEKKKTVTKSKKDTRLDSNRRFPIGFFYIYI